MFIPNFKYELIIRSKHAKPFFKNLSDPASCGLENGRNFYLNGSSGRIGAWYASPHHNDNNFFILALHGTAGTRALDHRVLLLNRLSRMGFYALMIDYAGFADSDGTASEGSMVDDAFIAYQWLQQQAKGRPIFIMGTSLGSAISLQLAAKLKLESGVQPVNGVVLLASFSTILDVVRNYFWLKPAYYFIPNFESYISVLNGKFDNLYWIEHVKSPILILHDIADEVCDVNMVRQLYSTAQKDSENLVKYVEIDEGLPHRFICKAKDFNAIVADFTTDCLRRRSGIKIDN